MSSERELQQRRRSLLDNIKAEYRRQGVIPSEVFSELCDVECSIKRLCKQQEEN